MNADSYETSMDNDAIDSPIFTDYYTDYEEVSAEPEALKPGKYILELPRTMAMTVRTDKSGRTGLDFALGTARVVADAEGNPLRGYVNKFLRVSTLPRGNQKYSDAGDLLGIFGIDFRMLTTKEAWVEAMDSIAGKHIPALIRMGYEGYYKHPLTQKPTYLHSKDFYDAENDTYAKAAFLVDGTLTLNPPFPEDIGDDFKARSAYAKANGWAMAYANFEPDGFRKFGVKPPAEPSDERVF